jgi:hypothetical protein
MATNGRFARKNVTNEKPIRYQRPIGLFPWAKDAANPDESGTVWISMKPSKIRDQYSKGAGTIDKTDLDIEFLFLAPLSLNENIVHHWEAYESVASRLAQKARSAVKLGNEGSALLKVGENFLSADKLKNIFSKKGVTEGNAIETYATRVYNLTPGSQIPNIKVDTPLYYSNSERRQIEFSFQMFNENVPGMNPEDVLWTPIKKLMEYSSPDLQSNIQIEFPYMWDIRTKPVEFIHYSTCALVGVQPTWNGPYINHLPSSCNLQLTFTDLSPLYAGTIESGSIINVISNNSTAKKRQQKQVKRTSTMYRIDNPATNSSNSSRNFTGK